MERAAGHGIKYVKDAPALTYWWGRQKRNDNPFWKRSISLMQLSKLFELLREYSKFHALFY